jgi:hypothetical protein
MLYKMVTLFGKVFGVVIIAIALTVLKAISVKYFTQMYLQNIHTNSLLKMLPVASHFLVLFYSLQYW